jgi:hypothetical protein
MRHTSSVKKKIENIALIIAEDMEMDTMIVTNIVAILLMDMLTRAIEKIG